jgi:hypothetical protein
MQFLEGYNKGMVNIFRAGHTLEDAKLVARKWLPLVLIPTCYEKCYHVDWHIDTSVSENIATCIFRIAHEQLDGYMSYED